MRDDGDGGDGGWEKDVVRGLKVGWVSNALSCFLAGRRLCQQSAVYLINRANEHQHLRRTHTDTKVNARATSR